VPRHTLRKQPRDQLTLAMAALTTALLTAAAWVITHPAPADPGQVCRPLPGTTRLDCGE
jgi:hypothetical protein